MHIRQHSTCCMLLHCIRLARHSQALVSLLPLLRQPWRPSAQACPAPHAKTKPIPAFATGLLFSFQCSPHKGMFVGTTRQPMACTSKRCGRIRAAGGQYARELEVSIDAVRLACAMCQKIQAGCESTHPNPSSHQPACPRFWRAGYRRVWAKICAGRAKPTEWGLGLCARRIARGTCAT